MKKLIFLLIALFVGTLLVNAQSKNKNTVYVVTTPNSILYETRTGIAGGAIYSGRMGNSIGGEYSYELFNSIEILAGVHYAWNRIHSMSSGSEGPNVPRTNSSFNVDYVTVPLQLQYNFWNCFFLNGGTVLNFNKKEEYNEETKLMDSSISSKFGLIVGIGAKFDFQKDYCLVINPYFQTNDLSSGRHVNFYNLGVKIGLGYKF